MKVWVKRIVHGDDNSDILSIAVDERCANREIVKVAVMREDLDPDDDELYPFYEMAEEGRYEEAYAFLMNNSQYGVTLNNWWEVTDYSIEEKLDATT